MSLPTATLIWHCPFITIFHSADKKISGPGYREFALIRIDGEYWETDNAVKNEIIVRKRDDLAGWDDWKKKNIKNVTTLNDDDTKDIYAALSGDQVALTDIRISR